MTIKNVVILNDYCHINGGASKVAIDEATGLARAGVNVIFIGACAPICPELANPKISENIKIICLNQTELIKAGKNPFIMLQALWNVKAAKATRNLLKNMNKSDTIVHLHGYTKALTVSPVKVANKMGFKVVCTLHDFFPACPNGALFDYNLCKPCHRKAMSLDCIKAKCDKRHYFHKIYRVVRGFIQKNIGGFPKNVKNYITLSNNSASLLKPYLPSNANYYSLENPIDIPKKPPVDVTQNKSVVAVGRLDAEKGIEILLEAAKKAGISLTLVGDGELKKLAEPYDNCHLTGWVSPARVIEELEKARCLVFPSLWYETYGLVVAEAMAKGIPAIVSDISAAAERIEHGKNGWHIKSGDAEDLAKYLALTKNDELIRKAGELAYESFWKNPPITQNHIEKLIDIYTKIKNE
ncbi:MAG: glycosyltransferase [Rickettsiales bacterium]